MICDLCKDEKGADAIKRMGPKEGYWPGFAAAMITDPVLCTACCSRAPGREWMRRAIPQPEPVV